MFTAVTIEEAVFVASEVILLGLSPVAIIGTVALAVYVASNALDHFYSQTDIDAAEISFTHSKPKTGISVKGGHSKNASGSTKEKHEGGDARRKRDQGGSKGRNKDSFKSRSNKRVRRMISNQNIEVPY